MLSTPCPARGGLWGCLQPLRAPSHSHLPEDHPAGRAPGAAGGGGQLLGDALHRGASGGRAQGALPLLRGPAGEPPGRAGGEAPRRPPPQEQVRLQEVLRQEGVSPGRGRGEPLACPFACPPGTGCAPSTRSPLAARPGGAAPHPASPLPPPGLPPHAAQAGPGVFLLKNRSTRRLGAPSSSPDVGGGLRSGACCLLWGSGSVAGPRGASLAPKFCDNFARFQSVPGRGRSANPGQTGQGCEDAPGRLQGSASPPQAQDGA